MNQVVDARGLSCPQPVLDTLNVIKKLSSGEVTVLVDTDTSRENVIRAAAGLGWDADVTEKDGVYQIILKK
ncbi:sulfurtransferase TusA family protein [Syntrophorhabdus aromaticivorans]|uniref:Preprotein translocase subunit TatB n=1 Tax=Syntrophorhabdus aromaticivorans TaxID=328301 RepID=A0A351TZH6_9BACT|nr:sulfurtransferase TusA family protein [Syntrophorhabdus aromaticivorans]NLW36247.1 preprotein translocase subunit TatB [Syntrophorhabdus aromaticivorans]HBA53107.1 preprotein translocase subunit TatB [Syntrophorhabdus aromaticivorans]